MKTNSWGIAVNRNEPSIVSPHHSASELDVEAKARCDAQREELATSGGRTPTELEIDAYHEAMLRRSTEAIAHQLDAQQAVQDGMRGAFERPDFEYVVQDVEHQAAAHKTRFKDATAELQREEKLRQIDYNAFRAGAGLTRQPVEPSSVALHWALVFAFCMAESLANAPFFSVRHMLGLAGGLSVSICIAALSVFLAARAGVILRYINHINWYVKALAAAFGLIFGVFLLTFHLGVGHFRNALAGLIQNVGPGEAGRAALAALTQVPFSLMTIESWALVVIGMTFALIALLAGYRARDPYPGHSDVAERMRAASAALRAHKDGYLVGLNAIFEGEPGRGGHPSVEARLKKIRQSALDAMATYRVSAAETTRLMPQYRAMHSQVEASRTYCICRYRAVYCAVRQCAPVQFAAPERPLVQTEARDLSKYVPALIDQRTLHTAVAEAFAAAMQKARALQREYLDGAPALFAELGLEPGKGIVNGSDRSQAMLIGSSVSHAIVDGGSGNRSDSKVAQVSGPEPVVEAVSEVPFALRERVTRLHTRPCQARRGALRGQA